MHAFIPTLITNMSQSSSFIPHFAYVKADKSGQMVDITLDQCSVASKCIQWFTNTQFNASSLANYAE